MVSGTARRTFAAAGVLAAIVGGAVIARADDPSATSAQSRDGGLAISPLRIERPAAAGAADTVRVTNNSSLALDVEVNARPWRQSSDGETRANRRGTLGGVRLSEREFELAPGATKDVTVTLTGGGHLYGALEVIGLPADLSERKGIVAGYRLISPLRYTPAEPKSSFKTGAAKVVGKGKNRTLTLTLRNTGNTIEPVSGNVRLRSSFGTRNVSVKALRILPRKSVRVPLLSGNRLRPGKYTAAIRLTQAGERTSLTKRITVRR